MAVCDKTFSVLTDPGGPYAAMIEPVPPFDEIPLNQTMPFDCDQNAIRHPSETKGLGYRATQTASGDACCGPDCCS